MAVLNEGSQAGIALWLYPNPVSGAVTLELNGNAPVSAVRVSNAQGQLQTLSLPRNSLNVGGLATGVYVIEMLTQDGRALRQRLVKE